MEKYRPFCIDYDNTLHKLVNTFNIECKDLMYGHLSKIYDVYNESSAEIFAEPFKLIWIQYYGMPTTDIEQLEYYSFRELVYAYTIFDMCAYLIRVDESPGDYRDPYKTWCGNYIQKFYDLAIKWPWHLSAYDTFDDKSKILRESWTSDEWYEINKKIWDQLNTNSYIRVGEYVDDIIDIFIEKIKNVLREKEEK